MRIVATYREPFSFTPRVKYLDAGVTLSQMRDLMPGLPKEFDEHGVICLNGYPVPRESWALVRPRAPAITEVTFHCPPRGSGGDDGKSILALVASIGLTVLSAGIINGGWAATGTWFGIGSSSAYALAAGVSLVGSMLLSSLVAPPVLRKQQSQDDPGNASATGNVLSVNAPIPRVLGSRKVYPPLACEPLTYFSGPDEIVEAVFVLSGPHQIDDIRIGASPIDSMLDVEYETREGWPGDLPIEMATRQSKSEDLRAEMRSHVLSDEDSRTLDPVDGGYALSVPRPQVVTTRDSPDEHQFQFLFPQGLGNTSSANTKLRVPIRVRMREVGSPTWVNLPEFHFQGARIGQIRATLRVVWVEDAAAEVSAASGEGWNEVRYSSPGQTSAPASPGYTADSYFYSGSGDFYRDSQNLGSSGLQHVEMDRYTATVKLDTAVFPRGRYEFEILRGCAFNKSSYSASAYTYSGSVWDFFGYRGDTPIIAMSTDNVSDSLYILRSVSIWDEHPLPSRDLACVAVRAKNRQLEGLSVFASGWVKDWDGSDWVDWTITSNPAPHLRDILVGAENADPVPISMIDNDNLVEFRQHCIDMSYVCNAIMEDQTVDDATRIVASCGYAKPYMSDLWGVVMDRDRSSESVMQVFTPRNMSDFKWTRAFPSIPEGFRVNFPDASRDYNTHQISVFREGYSDPDGRMEQVTLEGLVSESDVRKKAQYDLDQPRVRGTFYSWRASAESIRCRKGSLVGVVSQSFSEWHGAARVIGVVASGGILTQLILDQSLSETNNEFLDDLDNMSLEDDLEGSGVQIGVGIRRTTGVTIHYGAVVSGNTVTFSPGIDDSDIYLDTLVVCGPVGEEMLRLIVTAITPERGYSATITAVDEAPELWV